MLTAANNVPSPLNAIPPMAATPRRSGGRLRLDIIHSELGPVGNLEGQLDDEITLLGRWNAMELGAGQVEAGSWTAYLVTDDQSLDLGE